MDAGTRVFILDFIEHHLSAVATALRSTTTQETVNNTPLELGLLLGLEDEFKQILTFYSKPIEPVRLFECLLLPNSTTGQSSASSSAPPTSYHSGGGNNPPSNSLEDTTTAAYTPPDFIPPRALPLLHDLAQQMVQAGYQQQLLQIYRETRASVLEVSLQNLGIERLGTDDVQNMQGEVLEAKIGNWIKLMRIAVKTLFAGERKICDSIFEGIDSLRNLCFVKVTVNSVHMLFSFGAAIAENKTSPDNLFVLLDMYEIMRELQPEIESVYEGEACTKVRDLALSFTVCLAKTAQETFGDFEVAVEKHARKTAVLDGTVHPLTSYVINYLKFLFDYQSKLTQRFGEFGTWESTNQLETVTIRIMSTLQTNLDGESKQYKDPALTQLFLMNNIHYMVKYARRSEVMDFLGDDWVQIHERIVQQHANQYKRVAWEKILQSLSAEGLGSSGGSGSMGGEGGSSSGVSRAMVKDKFKAFNLQFEELHLRQSQWTVPDSVLRESLRLDFAEVLLPAYRSFIKRFGPLVENAKNPQKYIKYTPEDLKRMLGEFFEGKTWNEPKRQRVCE